MLILTFNQLSTKRNTYHWVKLEIIRFSFYEFSPIKFTCEHLMKLVEDQGSIASKEKIEN